jgi:hypothetical protein
MYKRKRKRTWCIAAVFSVVLLLTAVTAYAQDFIAPPESLPGGLSYQQWSGKWWQWVDSIPYSVNPIVDTTGIDCDVYQSKSGPVWFLAGTNGFDATRQCAIPVGRMIFFPIINWINDYPCPDPQFQPGPKQSLEQFLTIGYGPYIGARQYADHVTAASASLDGVAVQDLLLPPETSKYRVTSSIFNFNGDPSLQVLDPCVGPKHKGVSDGYWIMLKPLPAGPHTLTFSGTQTWPSGPPFTVTVTYYLTIY